MVYILTATGGTEVGSAIDFATPWLKFVLGFLGILEVEVIAADRGMLRGDAARQHAADARRRSARARLAAACRGMMPLRVPSTRPERSQP